MGLIYRFTYYIVVHFINLVAKRFTDTSTLNFFYAFLRFWDIRVLIVDL